ACNQQQSDSGQSSLSVDPTPADTLGGSMGKAKDIASFMGRLGDKIQYEKEAIRLEKQGTLAFTFEKAQGGRIEHIKFLNELWDGQQEQILKILQSDRVDSAAPVGKYLATIAFRIYGEDGAIGEFPPPPPPAPAGYTPLNTLVIIGHSSQFAHGLASKPQKVEQKEHQNETAKFQSKGELPDDQIFQ